MYVRTATSIPEATATMHFLTQEQAKTTENKAYLRPAADGWTAMKNDTNTVLISYSTLPLVGNTDVDVDVDTDSSFYVISMLCSIHHNNLRT